VISTGSIIRGEGGWSSLSRPVGCDLDRLDHPALAVDHPALAVDHPALAVDHPALAVDHPGAGGGVR
jgi:hypothetical protein